MRLVLGEQEEELAAETPSFFRPRASTSASFRSSAP
jgi:hypothetical protein